jgi:hypothetical protein
MTGMPAQILVMAKAPVAGRVKTRLCPPCTIEQAAAVAAAALADTIDAVTATPAIRRTLVLDGCHPTPPGWDTVVQHGDGLAARLTHAYLDTALADVATLLIGMDTPQATPALLLAAIAALEDADAALGPATDGGWWAMALREPHHAQVLQDIPLSTSQTAALTAAALHRLGLNVAILDKLRDIDTAADAHLVAGHLRQGRFAAAVREHVPLPEP